MTVHPLSQPETTTPPVSKLENKLIKVEATLRAVCLVNDACDSGANHADNRTALAATIESLEKAVVKLRTGYDKLLHTTYAAH